MKRRRILAIIGLVLAAAVLLGIGFAIGRRDVPSAEVVSKPTASEKTELHPQLALTFDSCETSSTISAEELGQNYPCDLDLEGIENVQVQLDGAYYPLEDALKDQRITLEELAAYAQIDARTGFCTEEYETHNGLTRFTYIYPDFKFNYIHCIYETPDGNSYELWEYSLLSPNNYPTLPIPTNDEGLDLDREDWGIEFTVTDARPDGLMLETAQSGGMQFGTLSMEDYYVFAWDGNQIVSGTWRSNLDIPIVMGGSGELEITWESELPPGEYMFVARLQEIYDPADVPALMKNYHDHQQYAIPFSISETE